MFFFFKWLQNDLRDDNEKIQDVVCVFQSGEKLGLLHVCDMQGPISNNSTMTVGYLDVQVAAIHWYSCVLE